MTPDGWRNGVLSDFAAVNPKRRVRAGEEVPFVEMAAVQTDFGGLAELGSRVATSSGSKFQRGDTLFARITPCAENGKVAFVDRLPAGVVGQGSTEFIVLAPKSTELSERFLYYLATSKPVHAGAISRMEGTSGRQRVPASVFDELEVTIPPLSEQKKIAEILESVDGAIQATQAVIDQTRKVKQGLLQQLLTRGIGHTRFKQTEIGPIPESWEVRSIGAAGEVLGGRQRSPHLTAGSMRPYLRVANVFDGRIDTTDVLRMKFTGAEFDRYRLVPKDILLNEGQSIDLVGRAAMYLGNPKDCCFQNTLVRFRVGENGEPEFFLELFRHYQKVGRFRSIASQTTSVAHLGVNRFANLKIPVPPHEEQVQIVRSLSALNDGIDCSNEQLRRCEFLKRGLMQDLLTGRVRVAA